MRERTAVLRVSIHHSLMEMLSYYPPKVWAVAWIPRAVTQIAFFGLFARFVGGQGFLRYALLGNGLYLLASLLINVVTASVNWERRAGTLPLLIASPSNPLLVFVGRNVGMATFAVVTGLVGIYVVVPVLGLPMTPLQVVALIPIVLAVALGSYGAGLFTGSLALYGRGYQNVISNAFMLVMLVVSGVNYPIRALPAALQAVSQILPLTHGLTAARLLLAGGPTARIVLDAAGEVAVGIGWALLAQLIIGNLLYRARAAGTLDYH